MLGIYNHMTLALAISALVALGAFMLSVAGDASQAVGAFGSIRSRASASRFTAAR